MADVFTKRKRSEVMSKIRSSGGPTEQVFRKAVRQAYGGRTKVDDERLPGRPDVSIYKLKIAVFMDGCFWHGCPKHSRTPKSNVEFWEKKISGNKRRDKRVRKELRAMGWRVWVVWEHELKDYARLVRNLRKRFRRLAEVRDVRRIVAGGNVPAGGADDNHEPEADSVPGGEPVRHARPVRGVRDSVGIPAGR
jgi:DNA mismatch endonuclease (patch repair protein)